MSIDPSAADLAAILAGLRLLQVATAIPPAIDAIRTNAGTLDPFSPGAIDALCARLNRPREVSP